MHSFITIIHRHHASRLRTGTDLSEDLADLGGSDEIPLAAEDVLFDLGQDFRLCLICYRC